MPSAMQRRRLPQRAAGGCCLEVGLQSWAVGGDGVWLRSLGTYGGERGGLPVVTLHSFRES